MVTHERRFCDHTPEKISPFVREAVKFVPVDEFLQLRFQFGTNCVDAEYTQMLNSADVIRMLAQKQGKTYAMGDRVPFSAHPLIFGARQIVKDMPLPKYLAVRRDVLEAAIARTARRVNEQDALIGYEDILEKTVERLDKRKHELDMTTAVAMAAGIHL